MQTTSLRHEPLTDDQLRRFAPSVFAAEPWHKMSDRYGFVPTSEIVAGLRREGLEPVSARQSRSRIEGKSDFTRHMLRFRPQGTMVRSVGDVFPEIVITNSHDGTSGYEVSAGLFRLACLNGMVVSDGMIQSHKVYHRGNIVDDVIEATYTVVEDMPRALEQVEAWQATPLRIEHQTALAAAALSLRYDEDKVPTSPEMILRPRRHADVGSDLWSTFNRVQEAILRGGVRGTRDPRTGRRRSVRPINGVTEDVRLNRALWTLATALHETVGN